MGTHIQTARTVADLLDNQFNFLGFRFGLDPIIGLVPVFGDLVSFGLSVYIIWIGYQMSLPSSVIGAMWRNVVFDFILGMIPFIGDVSDFFFKANTKNLALIERYHTSGGVVDAKIVE